MQGFECDVLCRDYNLPDLTLSRGRGKTRLRLKDVMDISVLKRTMVGQAKSAGFPPDMVKLQVDDAIEQALKYVWGAYHWRFKRIEATLTLTGSQEYADLPDDFGGFISLRYRGGTSSGWQLTFMSEDVYEYTNPNPTMLSENEPQMVKAVYDGDNAQWRAYFTPIPDSAYSLSLVYLQSLGSINLIPEGFEKLVIAACWLFMYPTGSDSWQKADIAYNRAKIEAIKDVDPVYQGMPSVVKRANRFDPEGSNYVPDNWPTVSDGSDY